MPPLNALTNYIRAIDNPFTVKLADLKDQARLAVSIEIISKMLI